MANYSLSIKAALHKAKYRGELFSASLREGGSGVTFLDSLADGPRHRRRQGDRPCRFAEPGASIKNERQFAITKTQAEKFAWRWRN